MINCYIETKSFKALVEARGRDMAIILTTAYDGEVPENEYFVEEEPSVPKFKLTPIKPGVEELFDSNPELANQVYEALGFNNLKSKVTLSKKFADTYNIVFNGETIGIIDIPSDLEGDTISIGDINIKPEFRNKGLGVETYKAAMIIAGKPLESFMATDEANRVWNSLIKQGLAKKTETGFLSIKNQITPQQKQQAPQQYSQYLDSIFPDSKVKDIVYHGSPYTFDKFDLKEFGTNEGVGVWGEGFSFTPDLNFAKNYTEDLEAIRGYKTKKQIQPKIYAALLNAEILGYNPIDVIKSSERFLNQLIEAKEKLIKGETRVITNYDNYTQKDLQKLDNDIKNLEEKIRINEKNIGKSAVIEGELGNGEIKEYVAQPEQIHILGNNNDIEGFKEFVKQDISNIPYDARFKLENKPVYTLEENSERKQRFIEQLKVGNAISFEYWSNISKERAKRRSITVMDYDLNAGYIVGYEDNVEKKFLINNIIDRTNPLSNKLTNEEIVEFSSSLEVGKAVSFFDDLSGNVAERTIVVESFDTEGVTGIDVESEESITVPYTNVVQRDTIENEQKVSDYVKKIRSVISTQLQYLKPRIKDAADQDLYNSILESQDALNDYKGVEQLESLVSFLKEIDNNIKKIKVLIDNIENKGGDIPSQLRRIGLLKDFIDGHKDIEKILNPLKESNPNSQMNEVVNNIIANIHSAEMYYFNTARPKLAKWLYDHMSPELNDNLKKYGMEVITISSLEKFLGNPNNDLTWIDTYLVASSNVNDTVTSLFSLALKRLYNMARKMNIAYKTYLMPLFDSFSKQGYNGMVESYRKMFFYEVIQTPNGPIAKRRWVTEFNDYIYYGKLNEYKRKLGELNTASLNSDNPRQAEAFKRQAESLRLERDAYIKRCNIKLNFNQAKEMMETLQTEDPTKFRDQLNSKFNFKLSAITEKNVNENGFKAPANSILVDGRYYVYTGGMQILNKELFRNTQYQTLKNDPEAFKMYEYLKKVYDECEKKLPIKQRLGGYVPAQGRTTAKEDVKEFMSLEESAKYSSNLVKLDGDVYKEIPLYFEKPSAKVLTDNVDINMLDGNTDLIDDSNIDNNMIKAILNYAAQANMYKSLDTSVGSITAFLDTLKNNQPKNPDGSNIGTNRRYDKCVNLADQLYYGNKKENPTFWTRLVDVLGKITQFVNLGFSPAVYINNFIMGNVANLSEAQGGRNFNKKELALANKEFFKMIPDFIKDKENSKLYKLITRYDAIQGEFNTELGKGFGSTWSNLKEESFYAFAGSNLGELEIQGTSLIALMMARGLWDKFDNNGDPITELDPKQEETFMNVLHELNKSNHGVYNDFDRLYLQPNALFRLMLQYRKYVVPTYRAKWYGLFGARDQAKRIDMEAGTVEQGYYASFRFFLEDNWRNALKLPAIVENYNNLTDYEKEGVRRSLLDVLYIFAGMVLLNALLPDEDDEEAGFLSQWAALSVRKSVSEVSAHIPLFGIQDQLRTVSTPFVAAKTIADFLKIVSQTCGYDFEDGEWKMFEQYDRKYGMYEKGDYKLGAAVNKAIPVHNIVESFYPGVLLDNFEKANRRG